MANREIPSPDLLRKLLRYEPETGRLFWKERGPDVMQHVTRSPEDACLAWNRKFSGREAFTANRTGYKVGNIFNRTFAAHRIAWAITHGEWPQNFIDHINGDRADNRLCNLRSVSQLENMRNVRKNPLNTSGITGVYKNTHTRLWSAKISVKNRSQHLGYFETREEAAQARLAAENELGFSVTHGRR